MSKGRKAISIPVSLYKKIEEKIAGSETKTVDDYVIKILEEKFPQDQETFTQEDEDKVKERLKALGYLD